MGMAQSSFLSAEEDAPAGARVQVLVPLPLSRPYDYLLPAGMSVQPGDYVRVPVGRRETEGVVWALGADAGVPAAKLKAVQAQFPCPPMPAAHRDFLDWVARYTMSDAGAVLKMSLMPEALEPPAAAQAYVRGQIAPDAKLSGPRQRIAALLQDGVPRRAADLAREAACTSAVVRAMADAGQLRAIDAIAPPPCMAGDIRQAPVTLSQAQEEAAAHLRAAVGAGGFSAALLDGVTGSGKTEVYFEAVAAALEKGRQALILLPEISLSAQFLARFQKRFGTPPAIWHSEVSGARRRLTWQGVASGETKVVIGARSALFLPFADLGLIVVDEEHDASYKQEEGVMYNARDMAAVRAKLGGCPAVFVSATPSLETMTNAKAGKYAYLHLPSRHAGAKLPDMKIVDMRKDAPGRQQFISPPLAAALGQTLAAGEQSLLFLNRRGYAPLTLCRTCGHRFQCPSCTAWLVEHRKRGHLQCHHCGYAQKMPAACPSCQDEGSFAACGPGVERIEEETRALYPAARIAVLASDVLTTPAMIADTVARIERGEIDIIIGTQIIAKGHHFPALTLVGVIDADLGLSGGDLRASERTFQLLHQVSGRAGRGEKPGRVLIQTYMPEQRVIRALAASDRDAFLAAETAERESAGMPPFGKLASVILQGQDENALDAFCRDIARRAPRYDDIRLLGPAPAPLSFLRGKHRRRFLIRAGRNIALQKYISEWLDAVKAPSSIQLKVDIDPQSFY
jgi:primosomal protein N' (replication factor Y)